MFHYGAQAYVPLFFIWGHTMVALSLVLAPWFSSPETALIFGWFAVILISLMGGPYLGTLFAYVHATLLWDDRCCCFFSAC